MSSVCRTSARGAINGITLHGELDARGFSLREQQFLHLLHAELGRLVGRAAGCIHGAAAERAGLGR